MYAQVTQLFNSAPDLLEDFKQFLPESAAAAKAAAKASEDAAALAGVAVAHANSRPEQKMPPVGNFAPPPSTGKDPKKRPRPPPAGESSRNATAQLDNVRSNLAQGPVSKVSHFKKFSKYLMSVIVEIILSMS